MEIVQKNYLLKNAFPFSSLFKKSMMDKSIYKKIMGSLLLLLTLFGTGCSKTKSPAQPPSNPPQDTTETSNPPGESDIQLWLTSADQSALFQKQKVHLLFSDQS